MGVMAIIGILAAVMLPSMITRIEDANSVGEDAKLEEIARALVVGIKASGTIPNPNRTPYNTQNGGGWGDIAYQYTTLTDDSPDPGTLHYVFAERTQDDSEPSARRVYLDDQFMTYLVAATAANAPVAGGVNGVFQTPVAGWPEQAGGLNLANIPLRMYIVSSSKKDLSLSCQANQAGTGMVPSPQPAPGYGAGLIADLQNWVKKADGPGDPAPGAIKVPDSIAQWGVAYAGGGNYHTRGEFLHVKVVDLRPMFCRVQLTDTACPPTAIINIGTDDYLNPNVQFFGNLATFNIYDLNLAPIAPARAILNTDLAVLINPLPQFINRTTPLNLVNINGRQNVVLSTQSGATPVLNPQPRFLIPISGAVPPPLGNMFPANIQAFYVLKSTALQLWDDAGANPVLTTTIESDSSFKYFGTTWSRVD
jgi:type II secretory pathway pseudopilin PulG